MVSVTMAPRGMISGAPLSATTAVTVGLQRPVRESVVNIINPGRVIAMLYVNSTETVAQIMKSSAWAHLRIPVRESVVSIINPGRVSAIIFVSSMETVAQIINRYVLKEIKGISF